MYILITAQLLTELQTLLPKEKVEEGNERHLLGNNGYVIVYPTLEEEIKNVLKYANKTNKTVSVIGGGTKRGFGGLTECTDILLSLENYKGIVEHTPGDMTLTVKAGTTFQEVQQYLKEYRQMISLDPASCELATIGGMIATNESGPKRLGYGSARDAVIGLRMIYPDGTVIRSGGKVVKNVAGYDMNKLFIGSMGTLGVITEVTVKLRPLPKYESLILLTFLEGNVEEIRTFAIRLLDSMMEPVAIELLNPSLSERLTGKAQYTLAISFEDVESSVHYQEDFITRVQPNKTEMMISYQEEAKKFWDQFTKMSPNGRVSYSSDEIKASLKIGVINLDIFHVMKESEILIDLYHLEVESHGGLGHGLCQIYLTGKGEEIVLAIHHLRDIVSRLDGYVIVKYLPFSLRQKVDTWGEKPSSFFLLEGIKHKIDPNKILNPSRFIGGI